MWQATHALKNINTFLSREKMRIAVVGKCQFSMFSGSQANATIAVAETLKLQGHDVYIVTVGTDALWWDDVNMLKAVWQGKVLRFADVSASGKPFDLAVEVGHHLERAQLRGRPSPRSPSSSSANTPH